ncbi:MAG: SagB/ThcOx family dehydrogenase [Candidatus Aquicultor sp.]
MHEMDTIKLPEPAYVGAMSVEEAVSRRRSVRHYKEGPLQLAEVAQLLWSAQGITSAARGFRASPSAGARYPIETYLIAGDVVGFEAGLYEYIPQEHRLLRLAAGDMRGELAGVCLGQQMIREAAVTILFVAVFERMVSRYGKRGVRYVHMDAALAAENAHLQGVALGLGSVMIGAFDDTGVQNALDLPEDEQPVLLLPFGRV